MCTCVWVGVCANLWLIVSAFKQFCFLSLFLRRSSLSVPLTVHTQNANQYFSKRFLNIKHLLGLLSLATASVHFTSQDRNLEDKKLSTQHNKSESQRHERNKNLPWSRVTHGSKGEGKAGVVHCNTFAFWRKLVTSLPLSLHASRLCYCSHYYMSFVSIFSVYMSSLIHSISAFPLSLPRNAQQ